MRDDFLRQRWLASFRMGRVHSDDRAVATHGLGSTSPDLAASDCFRQPHDFTTPGLASVLGILATLVQVLMQHLMQQGAVVGNEHIVLRWHVERDGSTAGVWIVRTTPNEPSKR